MISYAIATLPRSGGHLLCRLLADRGLGRPDEFFHPARLRSVPPDWLEEIWRAGAAGDIFGALVHWEHRESLLYAEIDEAFPTAPVWIRLRRDDVDAQARSWLTALDSGVFYPPQLYDESLDEGRVALTARRIFRQNADWDDLLARFAKRGRDRALALRTEDLFADPERIADRVAGYVRSAGSRRRFAA